MTVTPTSLQLIDLALAEDLGLGDATTDALVAPDEQGRAVLVPKEEGVLAGLEVALEVFRRVDGGLVARGLLEDGSSLKPSDQATGAEGDVIAEVEGPLASILKAERTALNFVRHLSGVATETRRYVDAVEGYNVQILDTRKTMPGLRSLQKHAVRMGGGHNHRMGLGDGVLIKDNHIDGARGAGLGLGDAVRRARQRAPHTLRVQVEVEDLDQVTEALDAGADALLLDNMSLKEMAAAVVLCRGRALTEASGRITLDTVSDVAGTGVDLISVGAITHSVTALDISLDLV